MEKTYRHRKTGELAYYKDGVFKQGNCSVEIGVEPSSEFWERAFKTEDGEIKFEKDNVAWYINDSYRYMLTLHEAHYKILDEEGDVYKIFSTEEKAKEYEEKHKTPILTTEDGVNIFQGDMLWNVGTNYNLNDYKITNNKYELVFLKEGSKQFSTKESAEKYILMNKPVLSLNNLLSVWDNKEDFNVYAYSPLFQNFKNLAKTKI